MGAPGPGRPGRPCRRRARASLAHRPHTRRDRRGGPRPGARRRRGRGVPVPADRDGGDRPEAGAIGPIPLRDHRRTRQRPSPIPSGVVPADDGRPGRGDRQLPVTGKRVEEKPATGTVRFRNKDSTSTNTIPRGSVVATQNGDPVPDRSRAITVPARAARRAPRSSRRRDRQGHGGRPRARGQRPAEHDPGRSRVARIRLILRRHEPGCRRAAASATSSRASSQADVDAAIEGARRQARLGLRRAGRRPVAVGRRHDGLPGDGGTGRRRPTASTRRRSSARRSRPSTSVRRRRARSSPSTRRPCSRSRRPTSGRSVEAGYQLVEGSSDIEPSPGVVEDGVITFPVTITARQVLQVDPAAVEAQILGKTSRTRRRSSIPTASRSCPCGPIGSARSRRCDQRVERPDSREPRRSRDRLLGIDLGERRIGRGDRGRPRCRCPTARHAQRGSTVEDDVSRLLPLIGAGPRHRDSSSACRSRRAARGTAGGP